MYWIYLIIFSLIVFVPSAITKGFLGLTEVATQEYVILILGVLGFALFILQDRRIKKNSRERAKMVGQINRTAKDLTHSYSYIGEINRKLDILMSITLGFPESSHITSKRQKEIYDSIMDAIQLFGKSDKFVLRFAHISSNEIFKEIKSGKNVSITFSQKKCNSSMQVYENDSLIAIPTPKTIDDVYACIIIKKKSPQQKINDLDIMKMLAMQALSLFIFMNKKKIDYVRGS